MLSNYLGVRFIYEEAKVATPVSGDLQDLKVAIQTLPAELLTRLEDAAIRIDVDMVNDLIEEVQKYNVTVADLLAGLVADLKYDKILSLVQEAQENKNG